MCGILTSFWNCKDKRFMNPLDTLNELQSAIKKKKWTSAKECFTIEIQRAHADSIETEAFYLTNYWTHTRTIQTIFSPLPIISPSATFNILKKDENVAIVRISYPDSTEKDMRVQQITLIKDSKEYWKISEVYGSTKGVDKR